jgi:RNA polymerase sigma-70 factor (TIGR02943 family)
MPVHTLQTNKWVDNYADYLYALALYKLGKKEDAEDVVQETFLSAYKSKDNFRGESSEKTWLVAILKNKIIDVYRKAKTSNNFSTYIDQTQTSFDNAFFDDNNYGRWSNQISENYFSNAADSYLISKEFQKYLTICIDAMPSKLKSIFISKYMDDEKAENICKEYNITPSNYWVIIFRSKTLLRTCLENKGILQ